MQSCLICDDHAMMREAISGMVELAWPMTTVTLASDFPTAWSAMAKQPNLCLCDLDMPGAPPLEGIERLQDLSPGTPILVITGSEDNTLLLALFDIGIAGFVPKTARSAAIEAAIRVVLAGERFIPARILGLAGDVRTAPTLGSMAQSTLSARQIEVLRLVAEGQSNKEIARSMMLSPSTVKVHIAGAMAALGATNRTEAVVRAKLSNAI